MLGTVLLIIGWVGIACIADIFFKQARSMVDPNFIWGAFLYLCTSVLALLTFRRAEFASVAIVWIATSLLISLLVSVLYFHERFTAARAAAVLLTLCAMMLARGDL